MTPGSAVRSRGLFHYAVAVVLAALATALKVALAAYVIPTFILAYPAVLAAAALGGIGPGILATVLSAFMAWYWVFPSPGDFHWLTIQEASALALFLVMGVLMSWMAERLRRSQGRVDRLEQARALEVAEAKFRTYVESAPDALFVEDAHGRFLDANPAGLDLLGVDIDTLKSRTVTDFVPQEDRDLVRRKFEALFGVGQIDYDRRFLRPDGKVIHAHVRAVKLGADRVMAYCRDVTEQRVLREQLATVSRLAAMGTLVAGVAHEVNNPLAATLADLELASSVVKEVRGRIRGSDPLDREAEAHLLDEVGEELADAQEGARRINSIVKELKVFARPDQGREPLRLADVVKKAMVWLPATVGQAATVRVEDGGAPATVASFGQIEQVVVHLVANAANATKPGKPGAILIRFGPGSPGRARLEVVDQGTGIAPEFLDRIFDPFFTTRDVGQGMGLGLSICHAIVTSHGGTLTVESQVGKGSTFRVELPEVPEGA